MAIARIIQGERDIEIECGQDAEEIAEALRRSSSIYPDALVGHDRFPDGSRVLAEQPPSDLSIADTYAARVVGRFEDLFELELQGGTTVDALLESAGRDRISQLWTPESFQQRFAGTIDGQRYECLIARQAGEARALAISRIADRTNGIRAGVVIDLVADFEFLNSEINLSAQFLNTSSGDPTSFSWDFGDGTGSNEENPVHLFPAAGDYAVTLTVRRDGLTDEVSKFVTVGIPPPEDDDGGL